MKSGSSWGRKRAPLAAVILLGCASSQTFANPEDSAPRAMHTSGTGEHRPPPKDKPRFNWPISVAVPVMQTSTNEQYRSQARYFVQICPASNGSLRIEMVDSKLVAIDGLSPADPRVADIANTMSPDLAAAPALNVDANGAAVDTEDLDELLGRLVGKLSEKELEQVRRRFATRKGRETFTEAAHARWRSWVQTWLKYDPGLGPSIEVSSSISGRMERQTLSFDGWNGARARLSSELVFSKEGAKSFVRWVFAANELKEPDQALLETAEVIQHGKVEADWPELRPHWASYVRTVRLTVAGQRRERTHSNEYDFDWAQSKAASCKQGRAGEH